MRLGFLRLAQYKAIRTLFHSYFEKEFPVTNCSLLPSFKFSRLVFWWNKDIAINALFVYFIFFLVPLTWTNTRFIFNPLTSIVKARILPKSSGRMLRIRSLPRVYIRHITNSTKNSPPGEFQWPLYHYAELLGGL